MIQFLILFVGFSVTSSIETLTIKDPVADFLSLPIADRYTDASEIVKIHKVNIDLDCDGQSELLVGHHKMWWGDNYGIYFSVYRKLPSGEYKRLTKPTEDLGLIFRDGLPEYNFVGHVEELDDTGLLICNPYPGDPDFMRTHKVESRLFVSIAADVVRVRQLPGLDLTKESDLAFYRKYFPLPGKQGGYTSEFLESDALRSLGLVLPDWTKPILSESSETSTIQSKLNARSIDILDATLSRKPSKTMSTAPRSSEKSSSSTPWNVIVILIIAAGGLLWLLPNRRS